MKFKKFIPNFITCLNLFCGCLALVCITRNEFTSASWLVFLAAILDFADGFAARMLHAYSPLGKQLDSLADMVTFGLVPGFLFCQMLGNSTDLFILKNEWVVHVPFLITIFSALRLAKFNIDERQKDGFIGLPTPACTLYVISIPLILANATGNTLVVLNRPVFIVTSSIVLSFLLVAEIPMFSLKFKNFGWNENKLRYVFLGVSLILIFALKFIAIPIIILLYIAGSAGIHILKNNNANH